MYLQELWTAINIHKLWPVRPRLWIYSLWWDSLSTRLQRARKCSQIFVLHPSTQHLRFPLVWVRSQILCGGIEYRISRHLLTVWAEHRDRLKESFDQQTLCFKDTNQSDIKRAPVSYLIRNHVNKAFGDCDVKTSLLATLPTAMLSICSTPEDLGEGV